MKTLFTFICLLGAYTTFSQSIFLNETFYSGFLPLNNNKGQVFYWLFESRNKPGSDPLILWIGGGPGCSSEIAVLFENGPYRTNSANPQKITLESNPYSWNNAANVLYVDIPLGEGFSKANSLESNEVDLVSDFLVWFPEFAKTFPQFNGRAFYIAGNSYTGHFIPTLANNIIANPVPFQVNLKGVLIGNGWVDPYNQLASDAQFAFQHGLINQLKYNTIASGFIACRGLIQEKLYSQAVTACRATFTELVGNPPNFNFFNINETCVTPLCYNFTAADTFFASAAPKLILGVSGQTWSECNATIDNNFSKDRINSSSDNIAALLGNKVPLLLYYGDLDLMSNWVGGLYAAGNVTWSGQSEFNSASFTPIGTFGEYKSYENLIFYKVYQAGHLVAYDQPAAALDLLTRFIAGWNSSQVSDEIII